jgi:hypothetical protein
MPIIAAGIACEMSAYGINPQWPETGYCPVSYFKAPKAHLGSDDATATYEGITSKFTNADVVKMFNEEPELFLPQYGGYCAYAISLGKLVTVDPDVCVVLDEKLFLFSNEEARTAFEDKEPGIVAVADEQWKTMESERAQKKGCFSCFP